jgi:hypothetical protein
MAFELSVRGQIDCGSPLVMPGEARAADETGW